MRITCLSFVCLALGCASGEATPLPEPGSGGTGTTTERPTSRDELWVPIVLLVLVALCIEWAIYHRDGLIRIRRALAFRLAGGSAGRTPGGAG